MPAEACRLGSLRSIACARGSGRVSVSVCAPGPPFREGPRATFAGDLTAVQRGEHLRVSIDIDHVRIPRRSLLFAPREELGKVARLLDGLVALGPGSGVVVAGGGPGVGGGAAQASPAERGVEPGTESEGREDEQSEG